jgi:hypothetical protein
MKRVVFLISIALLSSGCVHRWVGRPIAQLEKEYGSPRNIQRQGDNNVYYYPDLLAGRGEMTFTVDRKGIIRAWCATTDVPGPWQDDIFGNPIDGPLNNGVNSGINNGGQGPAISGSNGEPQVFPDDRIDRTGLFSRLPDRFSFVVRQSHL